MPSFTVTGLSESNLSSSGGLIQSMSQWTSKDMQGDQVTTGFFYHFATALPAVYDKGPKFRGHNSRGLDWKSYLNAEDHALILSSRKYETGGVEKDEEKRAASL